MRTRLLVRMVLFGAFVGALSLQMRGSAETQGQTNDTPDATRSADGENSQAAAQVALTASKLEEIIRPLHWAGERRDRGVGPL